MDATFWHVVLETSAVICVSAGGWLLLLLRLWPRIFLKRYPVEVRQAVAPLSYTERLFGFFVSLPFLVFLIGVPVWASYRIAGPDTTFLQLFLAAYLTWTAFNLFDWLILDEYLIGVLRPSWLVLKGAEQIALRFDHSEHALAFVKGAVGGVFICASIAAILMP